jgi:hypothetical protein
VVARRITWLRHEWTLAAAGSVLLSVVMLWPAMRAPTRTLPGDTWDPALQAWQLAWSGWAVRHEPGRLWHGNAHFGESWGFAYSDSLLGYLPFGLVGTGPQFALLRYNVVFTLVFALAFFGAYVLARQLGAARTGGVVAGLAFAYAPWRYAQLSHLNILSTGGIALSLAMLARGHGFSLRRGYRADRVRPGWALAGWLVAAWQVTLGFGLGLPFAYLLAGLGVIGLLCWLWRRPSFPRRLLVFDLAGVAAFAAVAGAMAYPYLRLVEFYPNSERSLDNVRQYSVGFQQFHIAPVREWLWGPGSAAARASVLDHGDWEAHNMPGYFLVGLAVLGLVLSVWPVRYRLILALGVGGFAWLAMGVAAPSSRPYEFLFAHLPGWNAIRTPGRLVLWDILLLALLAAGFVTALSERAYAWLRGRPPGPARRVLRPVLAVALLVPAALVVLEGVPDTPFPEVPPAPVSFASLEGPALVLPTDLAEDELIQFWSADGFPDLANGSSGYIPPGLYQLRETVKSFPDAASVAYLRGRGVRTVVVERRPHALSWPDNPPALTNPVDGLGIIREDLPDAILYHLQAR